MLRTIYWFIIFGLDLIHEWFSLTRIKKFRAKIDDVEFTKLVEEHTANWASRRLKTGGVTVIVIGSENIPKNEAVLFISNHQGNFDIPTIMAKVRVPKGFLSKIEVTKIPVVGEWMSLMKCVFMDRNDMKQSARSILDGIELLKSGHSLVVFPEGTRSKSSTVSDFKVGSFKLATKSKVAIVPITIDGTYKLMEDNKNKIRKGTVNLTIHKPIQTKDLSKEEISELPHKVKSIIESVL